MTSKYSVDLITSTEDMTVVPIEFFPPRYTMQSEENIDENIVDEKVGGKKVELHAVL